MGRRGGEAGVHFLKLGRIVTPSLVRGNKAAVTLDLVVGEIRVHFFCLGDSGTGFPFYNMIPSQYNLGKALVRPLLIARFSIIPSDRANPNAPSYSALKCGFNGSRRAPTK